jgi:hypothetical protein
VELAKLLRHIEALIEEARGNGLAAQFGAYPHDSDFYRGQRVALTRLQRDCLNLTEKRSDLSNETSAAAGSERNAHE